MISLPITAVESSSVAKSEVSASAEISIISDEPKMMTCTATKAHLFYFDKSGCQKMIESCGDCEDCGLLFSASYLHFPEDVEADKWPVFYVGRYCKDCYSKD